MEKFNTISTPILKNSRYNEYITSLFRVRLNEPSIDLSNCKLSSIYHKQYFCHIKYLDLRCNRIKSIDNLLPYLIECHTLLLDDNFVEHLDCIENSNSKFVSTGNLKHFSLKNNPIENNQNIVSLIRNSVLSDIVIFSS